MTGEDSYHCHPPRSANPSRSALERLRDVLGSTHAKRDAFDQPADVAAAGAAFETAGGRAHRVQPCNRRAARAHHSGITIGKQASKGVRHAGAQGHRIVGWFGNRAQVEVSIDSF